MAGSSKRSSPDAVKDRALESDFMKEGVFRHILAQSLFFKTRMYGMTGGRGPVLKSGPRVER
jgi:hypothetical protein